MRLIAALIALAALAPIAGAQTVIAAQDIGAGAARAEGSGRILSSWVGVGLMGPLTSSGSIRLRGGLPGKLIGNVPPVVADTNFIVNALLGQVSPDRLSLHARGDVDPNSDGRLDAADVVRSVNTP